MRAVLRVALIVVGLFGIGYGIKGMRASLRVQAQENARSEWESAMVPRIYEATDRMWQCTSEIYAIGHGGGPVCKEACSLFADIVQDEQKHKDWLAKAGTKPVAMPDKYVCNDRHAQTSGDSSPVVQDNRGSVWINGKCLSGCK